jgi:hypothetical protein
MPSDTELDELTRRVKRLENAFEILANVDPHRNRSLKEGFAALIAHLHPERGFSVTAASVPAVAEADPEPTELEKPPTNGKGSSAEAWRAYAESLGIEVGPDASKAAIIEGVEAFEAQEAA